MDKVLILAILTASTVAAQAKMQVNPYTKGSMEAYAWCLIAVMRDTGRKASAVAQCSYLETASAEVNDDAVSYAVIKAGRNVR